MALFRDYGSGSWLTGILGPASIKNSQGEDAKLDGWLSGDDAKKRFLAAPETLQSIVTAEREKHLKCSTDEKPFKVDVVRDVSAKSVYLDITCDGCGAYRKLRVNESTGASEVMVSTYIPGANTPPQVTVDADATKFAAGVQSAADRLKQLERDRENARLRNVEAAEAQRWGRRVDIFTQPSWRGQPVNFTVSSDFAASAMPFRTSAGPLRGNIVKPQPLRGKPAKKPTVQHVDKLGLQRAAPAHEDEV